MTQVKKNYALHTFFYHMYHLFLLQLHLVSKNGRLTLHAPNSSSSSHFCTFMAWSANVIFNITTWFLFILSHPCHKCVWVSQSLSYISVTILNSMSKIHNHTYLNPLSIILFINFISSFKIECWSIASLNSRVLPKFIPNLKVKFLLIYTFLNLHV